MKFKLTLLSFMACWTVTHAQTTYQGRVTNSVTADPVPNTEVRLLHLPDSSLTTKITGADGRFEFKNVQDGIYIVSIFHLGYLPERAMRKMPYNATDHFILENNPELLDETVIRATRAQEKTPTTFQNISKKELNKRNFGQDLPFIISNTPSTVVTSDAGAGVGYTGIRIRGIDPTRINVTINGFPYNDAESQGVYWVNMPDLASSISSMQIQRGVGTSTNGSAAFGGSINISTDNVSENAFSRVDLGYGSFNTMRRSIQFGTGMLNNGWGFQGRYSIIQSDGFVDRATSDLNSMYLTGKYRRDKDQFSFNIIRGHERTYQAWWGIPMTYFEDGPSNTEFINSYAPSAAVAENMKNSDPKSFNYYTYDNQVDNYDQDHYQAFYSRQLRPNTALNVGLNYTRGIGYYEEYHDVNNYFDNTYMPDYGLDTVFLSRQTDSMLSVDTILNTDLIRRLWLDNHFVGTIFNITHRTSKFNAVLGGGLHNYRGLHYGELVWARYASNSEVDQRFYKNNATKRQGNIYLKLDNYPMQRVWNYMIDLQVRFVDYRFEGFDRSGVLTDRREKYTFFNPKAGVSRVIGKQGLGYFSVAVSNREPVRKDFVYSSPQSLPRHEQLTDFEAGYRIKSNRYELNANLYYMAYKDQLVVTGQVNDVGEFTRLNVDKSFRRGIELDGAYGFFQNKLILGGNLTLSESGIAEFTEYVESWDSAGQLVPFNWSNTPIAFSPAIISSLYIRYEPVRNLSFRLQSKYVSRQYLDNTGTDSRSLDPFQAMNFRVDYQRPVGKRSAIEIGLQVNNLFGDVYVVNGYTYPYVYNGQRQEINHVYPQAPMNYLLRTAIQF